MGLTYRTLRSEEYATVNNGVEGQDGFTPENALILAAFNEKGEIVSTWTAFACIHIEPFWIREDYRHSKSIMRRMTEHMKALLKSYKVPSCYTVVMDKTPVLARFARWFGAKPVDGTLFYWVAPKE